MTTIEECWSSYQDYLEGTVQVNENRRYWGRLKWFANHDAMLSPAAVKQYIATRQEAGVQAATINRELALLRACVRHAERHGLIDKAPIITSLPKPPPRMRCLTQDEAASLVKAADARDVWYERVYIRLALGTAQRPEAVIGLRWSQIDIINGIIDFRVNTNLSHRMKRRSVVPMNSMTEAAIKLAGKHRGSSEHVMHYNGKRMDNPRRLIKRLAKDAGVPDVSPHVLRHTAASLLLQGGVDLLHVSRLLGHASTLITQQVYFQHPPGWLKDATNKLVF